MAVTVQGPIDRSAERSEDGEDRDYSITLLVYTDDPLDGPESIVREAASSLPQVGDVWTYGNDIDPGARCTNFLRISTSQRQDRGEPMQAWELEYRFTNREIDDCTQDTFYDPLLRPQKVSGDWTGRTVEVKKDDEGNPLTDAAGEPITLEDFKTFATIRIEQNVPILNQFLLVLLTNSVNADTIWGFPPRTVLLSNASWQKKYWGTCIPYYKRVLEFEINLEGWDKKDVPNRSDKALRGNWEYDGTESVDSWEYVVDDDNADPSDPREYVLITDSNGSPMKAWIDPTNGRPTRDKTFRDPIRTRDEGNFFLLGVPALF